MGCGGARAVVVLYMLLLLLLCSAAAGGVLLPSAGSLAHCPISCGSVDISYPYGIGHGCFRGPGFELTCDNTTGPAPKLFLTNTTMEITDFDFGYLHVPIVFNVPTRLGVATYHMSWEAPDRRFRTDDWTSLIVLGCAIEAYLSDLGTNTTMGSCTTTCADRQNMELEAGKCNGVGCCSIQFAWTVLAFGITITQSRAIQETSDAAPPAIKAFAFSGDSYHFSLDDLYSDGINASSIGAVSVMFPVAITDQPNCESALLDKKSYACISESSSCQNVTNWGYSCVCNDQSFYAGNAYILDGCKGYSPNPRENCSRSCGNLSVPFPFGFEPGCSANRRLQLNCTSANLTILQNVAMQYQVTNVSVDEGLLLVKTPNDTNKEIIMINDTEFSVAEQVIDPQLDLFDFFRDYGTLRWAVNNLTCEEAIEKRTEYACISAHSDCLNVTSSEILLGYRCKCSSGFQGNPYIPDGCKDVDECSLPYHCNGTCTNWIGGYSCTSCPHGTKFDPAKNRCTSTKHSLLLGIAIGLGCGIGLLIVVLIATILARRWKKGIEQRFRRTCFRKNHGLLLEQLILSDESAADNTKIFSLEELEKATNNFDTTRVVGLGGHGTVYKGILSDQRVVAIKKSKIVEQSEIDQFINEVAILSQIIHRNVVKLFGCCLETEVPLLVYEFISNGTLYDLLHSDLSGKCLLLWDDRLRIAREAAGALAYLHSAASIPIFHRDIKSSNILLDDNLTAKVSDFGASRSISIDQTHVITIVQGTFGYLDPQYYHTGQLTEKSDVYSFGVLLVELLTRKKPIFTTDRGGKQSLSRYFLEGLRENDSLEEIVDAQIWEEAKQNEIGEVASLAEMCLRLRGEERPTMKEVDIRLELLRTERFKQQEVAQGRDTEVEPSSSQKANSASQARSGNFGRVVNLTSLDGSRCYSLEQEFWSSISLPR